jgi:hypothetical protein
MDRSRDGSVVVFDVNLSGSEYSAVHGPLSLWPHIRIYHHLETEVLFLGDARHEWPVRSCRNR